MTNHFRVRSAVALTCAFIWNTAGFNLSQAQLTALSALLLHLRFLLLSVFIFPFLFILFWLFPGLAAGWRTCFLRRSRRDDASRRWCAACGQHRWAGKHWRGLAEPLRGGRFLRITVSPVVAGVIADVRQSFKRPRDVQHRQLVGARRCAGVGHIDRPCSLGSACLSSSTGETELAINRRCRSLASEVWYSRLFVGEGIDEVCGGPFLLWRKTKSKA